GVSGDAAKRKEIQDFVKQTIAPYKYPRDIRFVTELPRNPSGKLQHFKLRDRVLAEDSTHELTAAGQGQA
ncbi:2-aminobenzoate-CoA ligase, partial [Paenarthrobacter sp. NPDC058233]